MKFRSAKNKVIGKLTKEENDEIQKLLLNRQYFQSELIRIRTALRSTNKDISDTLYKFAANHKMNLNKKIDLIGQYPDYKIIRGKK